MSKNRIPLLWALACLLLLFSIVPLQAADAPPAKLSLAGAVGVALNVNANLSEAKESYRASLSQLRIAGFNTQFALGGATDLSRDSGDSGVSGRVLGSASYRNPLGTQAWLDLSPFRLGRRSSSMSLSVRHPLTRGRGLLSEKGDLMAGARIGADVEDKHVYLTTQATVMNVVEAYCRAVVASDVVKVQQRAVDITVEAADGAAKRADAGLIAGIEVSRAELRAAQTKDDLNLQQQAAREALDRLMLAIGSGVGQSPELTDAVPEVKTTLPDLVKAIETGLANRSELAVYDLRLSDQQRKLAIAKDQLRPSFDVVGGLNYIRPEGTYSESFVDSGDFTAGVEVSFPLDHRITAEEKDTAERQVDVLKNLRGYEMEQVAEQVRAAYRAVESARSSMEILNHAMEVATDNLKQAQLMVELGLTSNREELDAETALTRAQIGLLTAKADLYIASVNLRYAAGEDLTTMGTK